MYQFMVKAKIHSELGELSVPGLHTQPSPDTVTLCGGKRYSSVTLADCAPHENSDFQLAPLSEVKIDTIFFT